MDSYRYMTKADFLALRKIEKKRGCPFNRAISDSAIKALDPDTRFPIVWTMVHNDVEIRARIIMDGKGTAAFVDMPFDFYDALPTAEVNMERRP